MKKLFTLMLVPCLWLTAIPTRAADEKQPPAEKATRKTGAERKLPFHGMVAEVDTKAGTIKVGKRVFHVGKETQILKDDKPMKLSEELIGQRIGGSYVKGEDGTLEARTIRVSPPKERGDAPKDS